MISVLALDLSPSLCGWANVRGDAITAGAFELPSVGEDLGALGTVLRDNFSVLATRFRPDHISYEAPILLNHDKLLKLRCIYGLGMVLELLCLDAGIPCCEEDLRAIKRLLTDDQWADKEQVARAVDGLGVALPPTRVAGRLDAADAVGCGLVTLQKVAADQAAPWIAKLRGTML